MFLSKSLVVLSLLALVFSQTNPVPFSQSVIGTAGNGTIYFQSDVGGGFQNWKNVVNPVQLSILFRSGSSNVFNTSVCLNHMEDNYPLSGPSIATNCPSGGFGIVTSDNTVYLNITLDDDLKASKTYSPFNITKNADLYLKPSNGGGFIADIPDSVDMTTFQVTISGMYCDDGMYPIGQNNMCVDVTRMTYNDTKAVNISSSMDQYFAIDVPPMSDVNSLVVYVDAGVVPMIQEGYFPEPNWYIPTDFLPVDQDDDNDDDKYTAGARMRAEIMTPGFFSGETQTFYLRLISSDSVTKLINVQTVSSKCDSAFFGMGCNHGASQIDDPVEGVMLISSTLTGVPSMTPTPSPSNNDSNPIPVESENNHAKVFKYDYSDDDYDGDYAYFSIDNYPDLPTPFWVRVSVANNGNDMAPPLYAKQGGYPSMHSNHYNASTDNDVVHQIAVKIEESDLSRSSDTTWYFAVSLPNDFAIWVGTNCANNCNDTDSVCMCNGDECPKQVDKYGAFQNTAVYYQKVTNNMDSGGACVCDNDEYSDSYDCSIRTHSYLWLLIGCVSAVLGCCCCCILLLPCAFFVMTSQKKEDEFEFETLE